MNETDVERKTGGTIKSFGDFFSILNSMNKGVGFISQEQYFKNIQEQIEGAKNRIYILGEDAPFMSDPNTLVSLKKAIDSLVQVTAFIPEGLESRLEELHPELHKMVAPKLSLFRMPWIPESERAEGIKGWGFDKGYIVIDNGSFKWDSTITVTDPETSEEIYFRRGERVSLPGHVLQRIIGNSAYAKDFERRAQLSEETCQRIEGVLYSLFYPFKSRKGNAVSQKEFFKHVINYINQSKGEIAFYGCDAPFMDDPSTIDALKDASYRGVKILGVVPQSLVSDLNERLVEHPAQQVTFIGVFENLPAGFMVIKDQSYIFGWDSTKPSVFEPEKDEVMLRTQFCGEWFSNLVSEAATAINNSRYILRRQFQKPK